MENILVGIDFDKHTDRLLAKATELAERNHAKIWLLHVAAPNPDFTGYVGEPPHVRDHRAAALRKEHSLLLTYADQLKKKGIDADGLLIQGATTETLLDESKKRKIDLIILGHYKHSFLYEAFFGSTSSDIVRKSTIPVLVIPSGE